MTTIDRTGASDADFTAPTPPEVVVETVARALWEAQPEYSVSPWDEISETTRERYRAKAVAAIAALPPSPAEEAVKRVEALLMTVRGHDPGPDDLWDRLHVSIGQVRAALTSPAPAPQGEEGQR